MYSVLARNITLTHLENGVEQKWGWISLACRNFLSENGKRDPGRTRINKRNQTSLRLIQELLMYSPFLWIVWREGISPAWTKLRHHILIFTKGISQG